MSAYGATVRPVWHSPCGTYTFVEVLNPDGSEAWEWWLLATGEVSGLSA